MLKLDFGAYLFDFDYTLCDATPGIAASYNEAFREFGYPEQPEDVIRATVGLTVIDSFKQMTGSDDDILAERYYKAFIAVADRIMTDNTVFLPGAEEFLRELRESGKKIAVVTTKIAYRITDFFEKNGCGELLDFVIGYRDVKVSKPDPEGLLLACSRMKNDFGIGADDIVYVGDSYVDAEAAVNAKLPFIGVASGTTPREKLMSYPNLAVADGVGELIESIK